MMHALKDPCVSEPLLKAAQQLQDAIKSARERRHSHAMSPPSLRSSVDNRSVLEHPHARLTNGDGTIDDAHDEKENYHRNKDVSTYNYTDGAAHHAGHSDDLARCSKSKSFCRQTTHSMELLTYLSESDADSYSSMGSDWELGEDLHLSELSLSARIPPENTGEEPFPARLNEYASDSIQDATRKALVWMQRDGENQAKENRAMQERLHGVILILNDAIRDLMQTNTAPHHCTSQVRQWKHLSIDKVEVLVSEWEDIFAEWKYAAFEKEKERNEIYGLFQEDHDARIQMLMHSHALERNDMQKRVSDLTSLCSQQQMICEDYASARSLSRAASTSKSIATNTDVPGDNTSARVIVERRIMDLQAKAKEAELHALHWQMAYEDQRTCYRQLDERFGMSIEESAGMHDELQRQQRDLSKMIHVDTLKIYQQKIAFLEDQVHDTKQQIACDHEQFLYEQTKWKLEKKHLCKEVEEIQDVSVKVLKLLLIREKLLKKQERAHTTRVASWHNHCGSLKTLTAKLMQECALILVVLQEHAITISNLGNSKMTAQTFPVKPVQIKKMIKRLKNMDRALVQLAAADDAEQSCCSPSDEADHLLSGDVATFVR